MWLYPRKPMLLDGPTVLEGKRHPVYAEDDQGLTANKQGVPEPDRESAIINEREWVPVDTCDVAWVSELNRIDVEEAEPVWANNSMVKRGRMDCRVSIGNESDVRMGFGVGGAGHNFHAL